jgi:hypothetical protein
MTSTKSAEVGSPRRPQTIDIHSQCSAPAIGSVSPTAQAMEMPWRPRVAVDLAAAAASTHRPVSPARNGGRLVGYEDSERRYRCCQRQRPSHLAPARYASSSMLYPPLLVPAILLLCYWVYLDALYMIYLNFFYLHWFNLYCRRLETAWEKRKAKNKLKCSSKMFNICLFSFTRMLSI